MNLSTAFLGAILALCTMSCSTKRHLVTDYGNRETKNHVQRLDDTFSWKHGTASQFLQLLLRRDDHYTIWGIHHDWVQASDVPYLIDRLESKVPCVTVVKSVSSYWPTTNSTEGIEAGRLLNGFIERYYPPSQECFSKEELLVWYESWKQRNVRQ